MYKIISILLIPAIILTGCSGLNTKNDYMQTTINLGSEDIERAVDFLPEGEGKTFITIMEKTYLNLLAGKPEISELAKYSRLIDNQVRYKISRGLKSFFFIETPEGYFASEHEIIWMHFLLCWGYALKKNFESARVEVNKSTVLLSNEFSAKGRFDDPLMRILCGLMWSMCGEWGDARTDFRKAYRLDPSAKWLNQLISMEQAPASIVVIMGGTGFEPYWDPDAKGLVRGMRGVSFRGTGMKSSLSIDGTKSGKLNMIITPDSSYWYERHEIRNSEISETIDDLKYAETFGVSSAKMVSHVAFGIGGGLLIFSLLGGAGIALALLGAYVESSEVIGAGAAVFLYGGYAGVDFAVDHYGKAKRNYRNEMNPADKYRFVRFLPEYAWIGWTSQVIDSPMTIKAGSGERLLKNSYSITNNGVSLTFGYYPDIK